MKNILLTNRYSEEPYKIIKSVIPSNMNLIMLDDVTQEGLLDKAEYADYILASGRLKIDKTVLDKATNLKMIQRTGVGLDSLDLEEIKLKNIPLYVNQGVNSKSVAEHTILLMLATLKRLNIINDNTKNGVWNKQNQGVQTKELSEQTVGLIGMGHIGQVVASLLKAFGAKVLYYDKNKLKEQEEEKLGISYVQLDMLFAKSDIISLHCPLTEETKHIINEKNIEKMKKNVIIINTARGGVISESDLVKAINEKKVAFAGLDVFEQEPINNKELLKLDNIIVTPHIGGVTYNSFYRMMCEAMNNIELFDKGDFEKIEQFKIT